MQPGELLLFSAVYYQMIAGPFQVIFICQGLRDGEHLHQEGGIPGRNLFDAGDVPPGLREEVE